MTYCGAASTQRVGEQLPGSFGAIERKHTLLPFPYLAYGAVGAILDDGVAGLEVDKGRQHQQRRGRVDGHGACHFQREGRGHLGV